MSDHSKGHYSCKHPPDTEVSTNIQQAVEEKLAGGAITCASANKIAEKLGVPPLEVGIAIDLQEGRISKCQLGLFGYGKGQKLVKASKSIMPALRSAIECALCDDRLPCAAAWRIAEELELPRLEIANACEMLGVRIKPCQLGAF
jgi:hypothetical protein